MRTLAGAGFVLLSALAFASTPAFVTLSYAAHLDAVSLVGLRCFIGALVLWLFSWSRRETRVGWQAELRLFWLGAVVFGPQMLLYFAALRHLDTSMTVALVYVYPALVVAAVSAQLRRLPTRQVSTLLALALLGAALVSLVGAGSSGSFTGVLLALATALAYATYVALAERLAGDGPPLRSGAVVLLGAAASSVALGVAAKSIEVPTSPAGWCYLGLHGLAIVPVGMASYYAGLRRLGAMWASIVDTSQPAIAAVIGATFLGERLTAVQVLGIGLILAAVVGLALAGRSDPPARADLRDQAVPPTA